MRVACIVFRLDGAGLRSHRDIVAEGRECVCGCACVYLGVVCVTACACV